MTTRPTVSGAQLVKALERLGYLVVRQRGSHVRLRHPTEPTRRPTTVPMHRELKTGTLRAILADANLTLADLIALLE